MKILLKALVLGCFLLVTTSSYSQSEGNNPKPINLLSKNIQGSAVIEYSFPIETNFTVEILDKNQKIVKSFEEVALIEATKKYDLSFLLKGKYNLKFKSGNTILHEQQIEKL
ncbi:hypothetical protein EAX61_16070 [Dokdonia sinensis]|uniref:Uncharacterized protein n=1 Tax=Dokdonia sinensis TaxID=2479847 RepID=A0A3M0FVT9_9FLAO|nr:hypothetical protein [Dokdonia sinensis]RMB56067.1 hypothetical protein EAX61_16070 [Dokdonia sinensis]